jgi:hypothetical protein
VHPLRLLLQASILVLSQSASLPISASSQCTPVWTMVPRPNGNFDDNSLGDLSIISASDSWAVGYHLTVFGFTQPFQISVFTTTA